MKKHYFFCFIILLLLTTMTSCNLWFEQHFFHAGEEARDGALVGVWIPCEDPACSAMSPVDRVVITKGSGKSLRVESYKIGGDTKKYDEMAFSGRTYVLDGLKFIVLTALNENTGGSTYNNKDYLILFNYEINGNTLVSKNLSKDAFASLAEAGKITGFNGGNGSFYVTSTSKALRDAIMEAGVASVIADGSGSTVAYKRQ